MWLVREADHSYHKDPHWNLASSNIWQIHLDLHWNKSLHFLPWSVTEQLHFKRKKKRERDGGIIFALHQNNIDIICKGTLEYMTMSSHIVTGHTSWFVCTAICVWTKWKANTWNSPVCSKCVNGLNIQCCIPKEGHRRFKLLHNFVYILSYYLLKRNMASPWTESLITNPLNLWVLTF